jgi:hypothetical protein
VQRHQRRLHAESGDQQREDHDQLAVEFGRSPRQHAAVGEIDVARQAVEPDDADQQYRPAGEGVAEIDVAGAQRLVGAAVHHQRIGRQRQQLVEQEKREQVAGEGDAHGRGDAQAEEAEKARAVRRALEVADGVDGGEQPQHRRQRHEQHGQRVGAQHEVDARQQRVAFRTAAR